MLLQLQSLLGLAVLLLIAWLLSENRCSMSWRFLVVGLTLQTLLVFVAVVHLANMILGLLPDVDGDPLSLQRLAGWLFAPLAWTIGVPWSEAQSVGALLGTKTVLNELLAFGELTALPADTLTERTRVLTTYALCGFANFGSVGILGRDWRQWCRSVAVRSPVWDCVAWLAARSQPA